MTPVAREKRVWVIKRAEERKSERNSLAPSAAPMRS